jgi:CDP-diacylglycerol--serine O-phosphatidyltransferase
MLGFMKDFANLLTLAGLFCGLFGIYFAVRGLFPAAMIAMLFALLFDWFDGPIARRSRGRSLEFGEFGAQLDSLVDIVCGGVCPAIVLLSYCEFSLWAFPGAFMLLAAGVVRLSYFNSFGSGHDPTHVGLTIDNNLIAVPLVFLLDGLLGPSDGTVRWCSPILSAATIRERRRTLRSRKEPLQPLAGTGSACSSR